MLIHEFVDHPIFKDLATTFHTFTPVVIHPGTMEPDYDLDVNRNAVLDSVVFVPRYLDRLDAFALAIKDGPDYRTNPVTCESVGMMCQEWHGRLREVEGDTIYALNLDRYKRDHPTPFHELDPDLYDHMIYLPILRIPNSNAGAMILYGDGSVMPTELKLSEFMKTSVYTSLQKQYSGYKKQVKQIAPQSLVVKHQPSADDYFVKLEVDTATGTMIFHCLAKPLIPPRTSLLAKMQSSKIRQLIENNYSILAKNITKETGLIQNVTTSLPDELAKKTFLFEVHIKIPTSDLPKYYLFYADQEVN